MFTKTTIVATLGPASSTQAVIRQFIAHGVGVFRLNFSHGTPELYEPLLATIREVEREFPHAVAVMGDLCGPKIRISEIVPDGAALEAGQRVLITDDASDTSPDRFHTNTPPVVRDVRIGQRLLINDGAIVLRVEDRQEGRLVCKVVTGGPISSHKGLNLPDTDLGLPAITERDWQWAEWAVRHELDFLALSFVRTAEEIVELKEFLARQNSSIRVVSKIEKPQAVGRLEAIVQASDAVMVARGDLGVEMDVAEVPLVQKRITQMCRRYGKPVIVATQVLQSMIESPIPTRAEVSDIANAVMDFTDAVMLSGESAVGKYPLEAIETIREVCGRTEAFLDQTDIARPRVEILTSHRDMEVIARSVGRMLDEIECDLVVAATESGCTAALLSKARIDVPILALCPTPAIARQLCMHYGVIAVNCGAIHGIGEFTQTAESIISRHGWARPGGRVLLVMGRNLLVQKNNFALVLHTLPDVAEPT